MRRPQRLVKSGALARSGQPGQSRLAELGGSLRQYCVGLVIGTRPEAIKLAPVAHSLVAAGASVHLYLTGQHPGLDPSDHGLHAYPATPLHQPGLPDPVEHAERVAHMLGRVWQFRPPALVLVQGDTSSALAGARAAVACGLPLGHVEAGLRTHDALPWPEEPFRTEIDRLSTLLFAPTATSAANLTAEQCRGDVHVTGNSGIDALLATLGDRAPSRRSAHRTANRGLEILVTCHRRENWGEGFASVAEALIRIADELAARVDVILHPNPRVSEAMYRLLAGKRGIRLLPPLSHRAVLDAMLRSDLILSDSGGMQEEAPTLGIPLLVLRDKTERPEGLAAGAARLVGTSAARIFAEVKRLSDDPAARAAMGRPLFAFGDGRAAPRIAEASLAFLDRRSDGAAHVALA